MIITTLILLTIVMPVVKSFTFYEDPLSRGDKIEGNEIFSFVANTKNVFINNVIINKDLHSQSGFVSLFTYFGLAFSIIILTNLIYNLIKRKKLQSYYKWISLFAFYNLFYLFFQITFHMEGLRTSWKYSVNYFLCEIILTYFVILFLIDRIKIKKIDLKYNVNLIEFFVLILFFIIALLTSNALSFNNKIQNPPEVSEMFFLMENIKLNETCKIIKVHPNQPLIDYYFGLQKNAIFFGKPPSFYKKLQKYEKENKCFYYYDAKYFTEFDFEHQDVVKIDSKKIDQLFKNCKKSIIINSNLEERPFNLIKYIC